MDHIIKFEISHQPNQAGVPTHVSVAFKKGQIQQANQVWLYHNEKTLSFTADSLSRWSDGSIKWLRIVFIIPERVGALFLQLTPFVKHPVLTKGLGLQIESDRATGLVRIAKINKSDQAYQLSVLNPDLSVFLNPHKAPPPCVGNFALVDSDGYLYGFQEKFHHIESSYCPHSGECLVSKLNIEGQFVSEQLSGPLAKLNLTFFYNSPYVKVEIELHNPASAQHLNGQWDLGDAHAFKVNAFTIRLHGACEQQFSLQTGTTPLNYTAANGELVLKQYSSGGDNWQSPVHVNASNQVPLTVKGYQLNQAEQLIEEAERATPYVIVADRQGQHCQIALENFWQCFPKMLSITEQSITFDLLPNLNDCIEELQGGEKLHNTLWLALDDKDASLAWVNNKPIVSLAEGDIPTTESVPYLASVDSSDAPLSTLLNSAFDPLRGFIAKREQIDEYGWRHFGDLYADHETAGYQGKQLFVSHYNNQYDPIFGFLRQFLLSGDPRWFRLADDLAKHVVNIDIYHTELDKPEYNGGLFWHTDHYVKAYTSSHRSYSKLQESNVYQDHAGGGGPGGQHCYTTGLTYHYFLTGKVNSKQAVLTLTDWISHVYEGTDTCLELLLAIKNRNVAGLKKHLIGQYPLDRGTGNYIVALLDSFELTSQKKYLSRAEHVIQNTIHPLDDVSARDLENVENCWFYTVLLQSVCRYLDTKRQSGELDQAFYYARDALLRYAEWMLSHERPYLAKPEILEFPNDTWAAQDLRKSHVLAAAWYYSPEKNPAYLQKAEFFQNYVYRRLSTSAEKTYTRVLALLMQNSGTLNYYQDVIEPVNLAAKRSDWPLPAYLTMTTFQGCWYQLNKRLKTLSVAKEYRWLMKRMRK